MSKETDMPGTKYIGARRVLKEAIDKARQAMKSRWTHRILVPFSAVVAVTFGLGSTAFASPVHVVSGDTFSALVSSHCGTNNWQDVALPNRDKNLIYAGETIDITCATSSVRVPPAVTTPSPVPVPVVKQTSATWFSPLPGHKPWCNYWQWRSNGRGGYNHRGEDIAAATGTPIHAVHSGNVRAQYDARGGGNMAIVTHDGMAETYHHLRSPARTGWVNGGGVVGYVGSTGDATGPHLHLEIQPHGPWNGVTNPSQWLAARGVKIGC